MTRSSRIEDLEARIARASIPVPPIADVVLSTGRVARCGIHTAQVVGDDVTDAERAEAWSITNARCAALDAERSAAGCAAREAYRATGVAAQYDAWKASA